MDEIMGTIKLFAGTFAPKGYMSCQGQLLSISQNSALFSILGTYYGGDGVTTFALPNLSASVAIGVGTDTANKQWTPGMKVGNQAVTLTTLQLPSHTHTNSVKVSSANATASTPTAGASIATPGSVVNRVFNATLGFNAATPDIEVASGGGTTGITGGNQPVNVMQPSVAMYYIMCTEGIYPTRP